MKFLLCLIVSCQLLSSSTCFAQTVQKPINTQHYLPIDSIIGKWVSYSTEFEKRKVVAKTTVTNELTRVLCNVCPEINFKADFTATIKPEGSDEAPQPNFLWTTLGNNLLVRQLPKKESSKSESAFLSAGQYSIGARGSKILGMPNEIILTDKNGVRYILTRSSK